MKPLSVHVVVLTKFDDKMLHQKALELGASSFVTKYCNLVELIKMRSLGELIESGDRWLNPTHKDVLATTGDSAAAHVFQPEALAYEIERHFRGTREWRDA